MNRFFIVLITILLLLAGCQAGTKQDSASSKKTELIISAAASLQDALKEIETTYKDKHPNIQFINNFGSSGALQQQLAQGANADLFFSAAEEPFDALVKSGEINQDHTIDLIGNEIVLIVPKKSTSSIKSFEDLKNSQGKIALGTPESVPAGTYGKEVLTKMKLWNQVRNKAVYGKDVRQVLSYVETGNVDAGIVYKTDTLVSKKVDIVDKANTDTHSPIVYPLGIIKSTKHLKETKAFYEYLQSDEAVTVFKKYGFQIR
ncbi:molybdate ABC transporter substrate-binding protein [Bacillus sp. NPDC077027]|uniref:molybdate ABC transporter substrate-binding protein n=1 Tax=Bacillus sp. NPDC077027 TaxID=3390548 RepID=UPI003CFD0E80